MHFLLAFYSKVKGVPIETRRKTTRKTIAEKRCAAQYAYMTNISVNSDRCVAIVNQGGRIRWKIENQGFNTQKKGGYELEHAYSENENATKCFYYLLQIAHILNQLIEKGSLLSKEAKVKMGSIKNIASFLLEGFRNNQITKEIFESLFAKPFQIRFSSA